jgi:hypothetical protein
MRGRNRGWGSRTYRCRESGNPERLAGNESAILLPTPVRHFDREKATRGKAPTTVKKGHYVRLSKIGRAPGGAEPCPIQYYASCIFDDVMSMPLDYVMDGYLLESLRPKGVILLLRFVRNGVVRRGLFRSSPIRRIHCDVIETQNSFWRIQRVPPLMPIEDEERP